MALWGYCLGSGTGESCCHVCFCELQRVIVSIQEDSFMYLFGWINQLGANGPLGLLSGPLYRRKLLSLVFMWTLRCNSFNAKRFIHVSFQLNNAIWVWPFGATVWGQIQEKNCCHCYFQFKYSPMSDMRQFLSVYCFSWINNFLAPYFVTPRLSVQDVTRQQCKFITLGLN